jgi:AraC-like DNA-binding protein
MKLEDFSRYIPPIEEELNTSLYVGNGGRTLIPPYTPYPPGRHPDAYQFTWSEGRVLDDYQIVYVTRGRGVFESEGQAPVLISAGDVFFLFPGVWHRYEPDPETGWDEHYVGLRGPHADQAFRDFGLNPGQPMRHVGVHPELVATFNHIIEELRQERVGYGRMLAGYAFALLAQVTTLARRRSFTDTKVEHAIQEARAIMLERTDRALDMEQLARELAVGYSWFRRAFREYAGISPGQYHLQLRLNRARDLLQNTRLPISQIALDTGFDTPAYFSRIFKKKTGQTPHQFRVAQR